MEKLPRLLKKREAEKTPAIMEYMLEKYGTCAFEVKQVGQKVKPHQLSSLRQIEQGFKYKIPDTGRRNPFDCICLRGVPAFVVWITKEGTFYEEAV